MIIKQNKIKKGIIFLSICLALIVLLIIYNHNIRQQYGLTGDHTIQLLMSMNPGFSYPENLTDNGEQFNTHTIFDNLLNIVNASPEIVSHILSNNNNDFERLDIKVGFKEYLQLNKDRKTAIRNGILSDPSKVKAELYFKGIRYKVKLRLKGDNVSHWGSALRTSYRIELKNDKTLFGFSAFSIQKPRERQYPYDQTFQSIIRKSGNLAPQHKMVNLFVNGNDWGIMNIEEHISTELLEKQKRKKSIVVRFSDEKKWLYQALSKNEYPLYKISDPILFSHLYNEKKQAKDLHNRKIYSYILENRIEKKSHIYDVDSFSKAYMLALAWGHGHVLHDSNTRYYFNPYTLKIEPITTDQLAWEPIDKDNIINFEVPRQYIDVVSSSEYKSNISTNIGILKSSSASNIKELLSREKHLFPLDKNKVGNIVIDNLNKLTSNGSALLNIIPKEWEAPNNIYSNKIELPTPTQASEFEEHVHIRHYTNGNIKIFNLLPDKVYVKDLLYNGKSINIDRFILPGYLYNPEPAIITTPFKGVHDKMFTIKTDYQGFNANTNSGITLTHNGMFNPLALDNADRFDFINKVDDYIYEVKPGNWSVDHPIIINGDLRLNSGTNLKFSENSYLIVKGTLNAVGSEESPITFNAKLDSWKGIYVLNSDDKSHLTNIIINNISALEDGILKLTGGVSFYKSDVYLENVEINNVYAEDAINIVNSSFSLNSVFVNNTISDGLDSDFSSGIVTDSKFFNIGGDALDFSGSDASIANTIYSKIRDKAVSVGEKSIININNNHISDIGVGISSKDGSSVIVSDSKFLNFKLYAAMSYIKKDFYGAPSISINNCLISRNDAYLRQQGTLMTVDNQDIPESEINVKELYKTNVMAK